MNSAARSCPRCSHENPSRARFCASCGLNLVYAGTTTLHDRGGRRKSRAIFGLFAGMLILFVVMTVLSFIGAATHRRVDVSPMFPPVQRHIFFGNPCGTRDYSDWREERRAEDRRIIRHEYRWRTE